MLSFFNELSRMILCKEQKRKKIFEIKRKEISLKVPLKQKRMSIPVGLFGGVETAD